MAAYVSVVVSATAEAVAPVVDLVTKERRSSSAALLEVDDKWRCVVEEGATR